jgi:hypothetical protein
MNSFKNYQKNLKFSICILFLSETNLEKRSWFILDEEGDSYQIMALIGLCSKSYCYIKKNLKTNEFSTTVKGKGVSNKYLSNLYDYEDYLNVASGNLKDDKITFSNMVKKDFSNTITKITKKTLSAFDDKFFNYICPETGELKSLPWGHYKISSIRDQLSSDSSSSESSS